MGKEQTLHGKLKELSGHNWRLWDGPVKGDTLIELVVTILVVKEFVDISSQLLVNLVSDLVMYLVDDGVHKEDLEKIYNRSNQVASDCYRYAWKSDLSFENNESWDQFSF